MAGLVDLTFEDEAEQESLTPKEINFLIDFVSQIVFPILLGLLALYGILLFFKVDDTNDHKSGALMTLAKII